MIYKLTKIIKLHYMCIKKIETEILSVFLTINRKVKEHLYI